MCFLTNSIAIIDSGIGGISILKKLISKFKAGNYIYYADNLYMPYGNKSKLFIKKRVEAIINLLKTKYKVDIIIIACNTASTCINTNEYRNVYTLEFDKTKTYLATNLTKKNLLGFKVIADRTLPKLIEKHIFDSKKLKEIVKNKIKVHHLHKYKEIVLGCTHYELLLNYFKNLAPSTSFLCNSEKVIERISVENINDVNIVLLMSKYSKAYSENFYKLLNKGEN